MLVTSVAVSRVNFVSVERVVMAVSLWLAGPFRLVTIIE
jgi:hypothetical protein